MLEVLKRIVVCKVYDDAHPLILAPLTKDLLRGNNSYTFDARILRRARRNGVSILRSEYIRNLATREPHFNLKIIIIDECP